MSRQNPKIYRGLCAAGCGKSIFSKSCKAKYCSRACYIRTHAIDRGLCSRGCGKSIPRDRTRYCSQACQRRHIRDSRIAQIEAGTYNPIGSLRPLRYYLMEKFGEKCSRCNWARRNTRNGRVPIEVEHIDGNWENNHLSNLTLLCPNCHSLTHTFRGLNRGKGRAHRLGGRQNKLMIGAGAIKKKPRRVSSKSDGAQQKEQSNQLILPLPTWLSLVEST
jgi:hypothetical protein